MTYEPEKVKAGEEITLSIYQGGERRPVEFTVAEPCGVDKGQWACVTCDQHFDNSMQYHGHLEEPPKTGKVHQIAWRCLGHDSSTYETP